MSALELIQLNLLSPVILCFLLGIAATLVRSDMRFPEQLYHGLSIYLLLAIGLKGGVAMVSNPSPGMIKVLLAAVLISACIPLWLYPLLRKLGKFSSADSAAVAAHYGSVSVVTFLAGIAFLQALDVPFEGFLPAVVAVMEVPGIIVALLLVQRKNPAASSWLGSIKTVLTGKSVFLLLGGLLIGVLSGPQGMEKVAGFFVVPFQGVLCLFLLEMGMVASRRFDDLRKTGPFLLVFAILVPVLHAVLAIWLGAHLGLSRGGAFILGILASSASYIAAPATVRLALPQASPALYLTSSLAITFPFNLTVGIPLYFAISAWFFS
ncbi:MAG: sodium-dependent bicarbonate transport family permease [Verrucomicrobia bacterium]|nr:sodium-dependent bicarbonate transport family permease [Verrucomicrobiota bacterium]